MINNGFEGLFDRRSAVCLRRGGGCVCRCYRIAEHGASLPVSLAHLESGIESFPLWNESIDVGALTCEHVAQHAGCGVVRAIGARYAVGDHGDRVGIVAWERKVLGFDRRQMNRRPLWDRLAGDISVQLL